MEIEIKNVKYAEWASEETSCFSATVYIDGKKAGTARNEGTGAPNLYEPYELEQRLEAHAKTFPPTPYTFISGGEEVTHMLPQSADGIIEDLLMQHLYARDLKRHLKDRIVFVRDDEIKTTKKLSPGHLHGWLMHSELQKKLNSSTILNKMPFAEALRLYVNYVRGKVPA